MKMTVIRTQLIVIAVFCGIWNNAAAAKQVSVDTDENLLLKICRLKFCASVNHIVSYLLPSTTVDMQSNYRFFLFFISISAI